MLRRLLSGLTAIVTLSLAVPACAQQGSFDAYLQQVAAKARAEGVSQATISSMLGGLTPNELSQKMHMDASTVSRNVERMCNSGWLKLADIDDARSHEIQITDKGMKLISEVAGAWEEAQRQAAELTHVSNLYRNPLQGELARQLVQRAGPGRAFFCNSGAEADEALLKLARLHGRRLSGGREGVRYKVICAKHAFHGRMFGGMSATPQEKIQSGFRPLVPGFAFGELNNLESFRALVDDETAAIFIETIGAACVALGLFTRFFAAALAIEMLIALFAAHWVKGFAVGQGGYEYVLLIGIVLFAIAIRGGGPYSVDAKIGKEL